MADDERQLLEAEGAARQRVALLSVLAGLVLFAGELWTAVIQSKSPTVGLLQGLAPAFKGVAAAAVDPRTAQEHFLVNHQLTLIIAVVLGGLGAAAMTGPLRYLADAERARSATPSPVTSYLAQFAPFLIAIFVPAYEISLIIGAHSYLSGHARTAAALTAATGGGVRFALALIYTVGELAVAAAFVLVSLRAMRVGLLTRMMGTVGIIGGVLFLIPLTPLPVVQALWLIFFGAMLQRFGGRPLPEAWTVAEARPWPSAQQQRAERPSRRSSRKPSPAPAAPPAPAPALPRGASPHASKKRRRRR
jgi:hypothetical protein